MKKQLFFVSVFFLLVSTLLVGGVDTKIVLTYDYSDIGFSHACSYYTIINNQDKAIDATKLKSLGIADKNDEGYIKGIKEVVGSIKDNGKKQWEYRYNETYNISVNDYDTCLVNSTCNTSWNLLVNNTYYCERPEFSWNETRDCNNLYTINVTDDVCEYNYTCIIGSHLEEGRRFNWLRANSSDNELKKIIIEAYEGNSVRFCADIEREVTVNGWEVSVDHIPELEGVIYDGMTWWNSSLAYRRNISCTNMTDGLPIVINGSGGFKIGGPGGTSQIVWTYCQGSATALYYNSNTSYVVANDTTQIPHEVESGNSTGYNPTSVWSDNYEKVLHLRNLTESVSGLESVSIYKGDPSATSSGFYGYAYDFDGVDDSIGNLSCWTNATSDRTYTMWVQFDAWATDWLLFDESDNNAVMYIYDNNGVEFYSCYTDGSLCSAIGNMGDPTTGIWYFFAITFDMSTKATVYINATEKYNDTNPGSTWKDNNDPFIIGNHPTADWDFDGRLDEFRAIEKALTYSEVNQTYQNAIGTVGYGDLLAEESAPVAADSCTPPDGAGTYYVWHSCNWTIADYIPENIYINGTDINVTLSTTFTFNGTNQKIIIPSGNNIRFMITSGGKIE